MNKSNNLFVAQPIIHAYNYTGSWAFGHVAFFITKHGCFDTGIQYPSTTQKLTGITPNTFNRWLQRFVDDGLLIKSGQRYTFSSDNVIYDDVFAIYRKAFGRSKDEITTVHLTEVDPSACDPDNMVGSKAEQERGIVTAEALIRDKVAINSSYGQEYGEKEIGSVSSFAKEMNVSWRTARNLLLKIRDIKKSYMVIRDSLTNKVRCIKTSLQDKIYTKKSRRFAESHQARLDKLRAAARPAFRPRFQT